MLAARRNDKVKGRTEILIVSISTRNGFNQFGAPDGNKWATNSFLLFITLDVIDVNHKGKPKISVKIKWEVIENEYAISPIRFRAIIIINNDVVVIE